MVYNKDQIDALHPSISLSNKVRELFKLDPTIKMYWNEDKYTIYFYCTDLKKAEGIRFVLPEVYTISECSKLYIEVYYKIDNDTKVLVGRPQGYHYDPDKLRDAFEKNPLWVYTHEWVEEAITNAHCWAGFSPDVIFYVDDNLENLYGDSAFLAADLAIDVLDTNGIHICTHNPNRQLVRRNTVANSIYEDQIDWNYDE